MKKIYGFLSFFWLLLFSSCKLCYLTNPLCLLAPGATTNVRENKFYDRYFKKNDTILSTKFIYEVVTPLTRSDHKYYYSSFLFYDNGLVLENNDFTNNPNNDTAHTFTEGLLNACCHGWSIGTYKVSNDTVFFSAKAGYQVEWSYFSAKIYPDRLVIFDVGGRFRKNIGSNVYRKNEEKIVLKTIKA